MKLFHFTAAITVLLSLIVAPAFGASPHPLDTPAINFQGRIEVGDVGYTGWSKFTFTIGNEGFSTVYWGSWAETTCTEGIYNVILGRDTDTPLTDAVFNHQDAYYLRVGFSTDGTNFETLSPDQEIVTVPFSVNSDRLDGLDSPDSAIVGISDTQTLTDKTLTAPILTRPIMDSTYFTVQPAALPTNPAEGYIAYDNASDTLQYYAPGGWVTLTGAGGGAVLGSGADTQVAYWTAADTVAGEAALTYDYTNDKLTATSGATTGQALQVVADSLTTGTALDVSSAAGEDATYQLVTFTAATGQALVVTHTGGVGAGHESVLIDRNNNGRALTVEGDVTTQKLAYLTDQSSITSGNILWLHAGNTAFDAGGSILYVNAASNQGAGKGITVIQRSSGDGIYVSKSATAAVGMAARFNQATDSGDGTLDDDEGGTVHIYNNQPNYALTVYSPSSLNPSKPLVAYKSLSTNFDQPILELFPAAGSEAPPLYLHPLSGAPDGVEGGPQQGMIYVNSTNKGLYYYNGADWLALTASTGGTGTFATVELDNLSGVAINTSLLPTDDGVTVDLGSSAKSFKDAYIDGTAAIATVDINAGNIDGTLIGASAPSSAEFTSMTADIIGLDADGAAANPALTWDADQDTGFYRIAANSIGIANAGTLMATFDGTGHFILSQNGSNTNPIVSLGGESNTGIYQADNENIDFTNVGTRRFSMR